MRKSLNKRPLIIGVGGSHSGAGKTTVAEALLKHLTKIANVSVNSNSAGKEKLTLKTYTDTKNRWGAIKYTKTVIYTSIIDDPETLTPEGKDTARLINAGAEKTLWVQSPPEELKEVLPIAVDRLSNLRGIIVEGNSAIEFLKPDVVIFIFGRDAGTLKKSAVKILDMADIILFEEEPSVKLPVRKKKFKVALSSPSGLDECIDYIQGLLK
jgi:molybdopterin-guanine dinucleotide biosynthesis protein